MAKWEIVVEHEQGVSSMTLRLKVEGGWLYRMGGSVEMTFVPGNDSQSHTKPGTVPLSPGASAWPSIHRRDEPPKRPRDLPKGIIDAEFEEIPAHEVNGSKVTTLTEKNHG